MRSRELGFSMMELLIVTGLVALAAAVAVPLWVSAYRAAEHERAVDEARARLRAAVERSRVEGRARSLAARDIVHGSSVRIGGRRDHDPEPPDDTAFVDEVRISSAGVAAAETPKVGFLVASASGSYRAVVVGPLGRVETLYFEHGEWQ